MRLPQRRFAALFPAALAVVLAASGCASSQGQEKAAATQKPLAPTPGAPQVASVQPGTVVAAPGLTPPPPATDLPVVIDQADFARWLAAFRMEAARSGISERTLASALDTVTPQPRVIELDRRQPEFTQTFWGYLSKAVNDKRIAQGRDLLARHAKLLAGIERDYGVQPRFLVAFWGLETSYGATFGGFPVVSALATLAYEGRRAEFFRRELLTALAIIDAGHIAATRMQGSWAGAMGHLQFMPSTFRGHAVDRDGDGRSDIWGSLPDVFASAAKYLSDEGWKPGQTWGREVRLPPGFNPDLADLSIRRPVAEWAALGVTRPDGGALPDPATTASVVLPGGVTGPAFLVYDNFRTIMVWNRSVLYALAVGHLADRLDGGAPLAARPDPADRPLSRDEVVDLQGLLNALGFAVGEPDGVIGARTRSGVKAFQKAANLPADGYPGPWVLTALRQAAGRGG